jgi:hypothetical protein
MAWISFQFFGLDAAITGGLFVNLGPALTNLLVYFIDNQSLATILNIFGGGIFGVISILIFPLHWLLFFRPDQPLFALALLLPWILWSVVSALIYARSMKQGFMLPLKIGLFLIILMFLLFSALPYVIGSLFHNQVLAKSLKGIFDSLAQGLAGFPDDMPLHDLGAFEISALAIIEGTFVGGVFGALIGAIKYDPADPDEGYKPKTTTKAKEPKDFESF